MQAANELESLAVGMTFEGAALLAQNRRISALFDFASRTLKACEQKGERANVEWALAELADRMRAHATLHQLLGPCSATVRLECGAYLESLCRAIQVAFLNNRPITVRLDNEEVWLPDGLARQLGLLIHELVLNAIDYAFDAAGGSISIALSRRGPTVECSVCDSGMGLCSVNSVQHGRGMVFIDQLAQSVGATCIWHLAPVGTEAIVVMELCAPTGKDCHPFQLQPEPAELICLPLIRRVAKCLGGFRA